MLKYLKKSYVMSVVNYIGEAIGSSTLNNANDFMNKELSLKEQIALAKDNGNIDEDELKVISDSFQKEQNEIDTALYDL